MIWLINVLYGWQLRFKQLYGRGDKSLIYALLNTRKALQSYAFFL